MRDDWPTHGSATTVKNFNPIAYLNSFTNFEVHLQHVNAQSFNLERVHQLFGVLGDPQKKLKFIHVAGTKGKGSTCAFTAYILRAAGYRVGLYTSPHFYRVNERMRILDPSEKRIQKDFSGSISAGELNALIKKFKPSIDLIRHDKNLGSLTYFEVLTGLALCYFVRKKADIVVLETGLGGRWDATNAVDALIDVITPISFDHTQLLGKTLEKIAGEKAAIIKDPSSKVVVAPQPPQAMKIIQKRCRMFGIQPLVIRKDLKYKNFKMQLIGEHQAQNAATAVGVVESLAEFGFMIRKKAVARGIRETRWPGRFEIVHKNPIVVIDCAHNTASAEVLMRTIHQTFSGKKMILILGVSSDKDIAGICRILAKSARLIVTAKSHHSRAYQFTEQNLKPLFGNKSVLSAKGVGDAMSIALQNAKKQNVILVGGSIFIAAEARAFFKGRQ